jgi:hypothetical protein
VTLTYQTLGIFSVIHGGQHCQMLKCLCKRRKKKLINKEEKNIMLGLSIKLKEKFKNVGKKSASNMIIYHAISFKMKITIFFTINYNQTKEKQKT